MMDDMVERVAKAISGAPFATSASRRKARAAIEAMREPTDAMLAACWPHHHPWGKNAPNPAERPAFFQQVILEVSHDWMAMLDAALSETPHEQ